MLSGDPSEWVLPEISSDSLQKSLMLMNEDLLPPMPWQNFANLTDEDLKAVFYYLKSIHQ